MNCTFCRRATASIVEDWYDQDGGGTFVYECTHCGGSWSSTIEILNHPAVTECPGCGEEIVSVDALSAAGRFGCPECGYVEEVPDAE